ncbi:ankyrin repeat domain-containing protein [Candidatus Chromulinivorax destructor]|uniref:Uncharacterized protein n=1 Tax=Candidatus Chromulinivorax destructor TaxID=2066483 RepID=A0A345ZA19_9BACT|nr:ankyrin repeat domain-containing protein [Candidatus Chromulinivorax destructor]AXK60136.1 hypothetical protein C0J27_00020 [Candidatus Chromulinivorax destructor]
MIKSYKLLTFFIVCLQASFLSIAQESSEFAAEFFRNSNGTNHCKQQLDEHENITNNPKLTIEEIKEYVRMYPHLDEGFRLLQIKNPLPFSFHDFLAFHHFLAESGNIDNDVQIPMFGQIIQNAENLIAAGIQDAFFSRELKFATKCIYNNENDDHFNEVFSKLLIEDEQDKDKSDFDRVWFFQIQTIRFVMKHRHNFMKNILKLWFDEECKILHQEYYNLIFKEFRPNDGLKEYHLGNMISTNIAHDNPCMLKFIIEIDPNYLQFQDKAKNGLLHYAAHKNAIGCAQLLINRQININSRNNRGATALFCAVTQCNTEITRILINAHADLNMGSESITPLRRAVDNNHIQITQMLLNAGANQRLHKPHTLSPLGHAAIYHYEDIVDILIHAHPNFPSHDDLKLAKNVARTPERKAEIRRIEKQLYPEQQASCCAIS